MGAEPYAYEVDYEEELGSVFKKLQNAIFVSKVFRCNIENPFSIQQIEKSNQQLNMDAIKSGISKLC